uniref:CSON009524 protein n=1 Tax=Culicoides sonorensis TaxID=179676 RepID=A0A336LXK3_CULSO
MALNIAVPLSGVGDLLSENFNLMSPIMSAASSPNNYDCRTSSKVLCSPIESESSGISSLDSEEIKKSSVSSSPTDDEQVSSDQGGTTPPLVKISELSSDQNTHQLLSPKPKHAAKLVTTTENDKKDDAMALKTEEEEKQIDLLEEKVSDSGIDSEENETNDEKLTDYYSIEEQKKLIAKLRIEINGRNILDLGANLNNNNSSNNIWQHQGMYQFAHLPENNLKMFLENRSQYHRLGANGHLQEYALVNCKCCDFIYPNNGYNNINGSTSGNTNSVKTNINGQMTAIDYGTHNTIINPNGKKSGLIANVIANVRINEQPQQMHSPPISRQNMMHSQNNYYSNPAAMNNLLKQQQQFHEPNINFNTTYNNNLTALNRIINNNSNNQMNTNNLLENIAAALLTTTNVGAVNNNNNNNNNGLNHKHFTNNNAHHHFNNNQHQQPYGFGSNHNNHFTSQQSYSYKQF